jgi:hypothetical protein
MSAFSHLALSVTAILAATSVSAQAGDYHYRHRQERVEPLSVNILDPHRTRVTRSPSGSVIIEDRYHAYHARRDYYRSHHYERHVSHERHVSRPITPYAPPAFHIIGDVSSKSAAKPVALNHGVQPRRGFQTQPKVIFLVMRPGEKILTVRR